VAGGANRVAPALGDNPSDAMPHRLVHDACIVVSINALDAIFGMNKRYLGHLALSLQSPHRFHATCRIFRAAQPVK
jgi:hypothetical protein